MKPSMPGHLPAPPPAATAFSTTFDRNNVKLPILLATTNKARLPFTLTVGSIVACDAVCPIFCTRENPFTSTSAIGHTVGIQLPYDKPALPILGRFQDASTPGFPYDPARRAIILFPFNMYIY